MKLVYASELPKDQLTEALSDPTVSVIIKTFQGVNWFEKVKAFPCFTVYNHPTDFPDKYVCRLFDGTTPLRLITLADTLEDIRKTIPVYFFLHSLLAQTDDPVIEEVWI